MFKELKENTSKELNEHIRIMCHHIENINKEMEIIKKELSRNSGVEKYYDWDKKFTR